MKTNEHACVHTYVKAYIPGCFHKSKLACLQACIAYTYMQIFMHTYMHEYVHTYIHTYIHTYVHTYIHTYILWLDAITSSLGTGDALKNKLDQNLRDQGLEASSGVSVTVIDSSSTVTATSSSSGLRVSGVTSGIHPSIHP